MQVTRLPHNQFQEAFINIPAVGCEEPASLFQRLYDFLADNPRLHIVRQDVFGVVRNGNAVNGKAHKAFRLNGSEWPVTWVENSNGNGVPVAGIQIHAVSGVEVKPLKLNGRTVGAVFEDEWARYCILCGLRPEDPKRSRTAQAEESLRLMEQGLDLAGMSFANVFRTWFYLDDILDWYGEFNRVRNEFFLRRQVYDGLVPASTGVGGINSSRTAVVADLIAAVPKDPRVSLQAVPSPLQCPALEYGSAFSRAVEMGLPGQRRLYVSGTASIAPAGHTIHVGDPRRQLQLTMEVVAGILNSRQMGWEDVTRGIGYFKHTEDAPLFHEYCREHRLPAMPVVISKNDICRDDLLFEIEVDAVRMG